MADYRVIRIFISSRDNLFDERKTVERAISEMGLQPILGDAKTQVPSAYNKEWLALVKSSDITILIIGDEDSLFVREEIESCISEGKSILVLKKIGKIKDDSLTKFLEEIFQYAFVSDFTTCVELTDKVREGIIIEISKKYKAKGEIIEGSADLINKFNEFIHSAKRQLFLIARTPPNLVPPTSTDTMDTELKEIIEEWIDNNIKIWSMEDDKGVMIIPEGRLFYIVPAVKEKIGKNKYLLELVFKNLERYKDIEIKSHGRFKITSILEEIQPLGIADDKVNYYSPVKGREGFGIYIQDNKIAKDLIRFIESHYVNYYKNLDELKMELIS